MRRDLLELGGFLAGILCLGVGVYLCVFAGNRDMVAVALVGGGCLLAAVFAVIIQVNRYVCPECRKGRLKQVARTEDVWGSTDGHVYRCNACGHREILKNTDSQGGG